MDRKSTIAGASLRLLQAFAEAARLGSFSRAARELGLTASAVTKSVQRLERDLGLRLFHRTTRRISLTQEGAALYERSKRVLDELGELAQAAAGASRTPSGVLRLDVPVTYGKKVVVPALAELARRHPGLRTSVRFSDQFADVVGSGVDAVVRVGEIADSRLVARRVGWQRLGVYGSRAYLERKGRPRRPEDLAAHDCVVFQLPTSGRNRQWEFQHKGKPLSLHPVPAHVIDDTEGLVSAACAGLGLVQVPDHAAEGAVAAGWAEELLARWRPKPMPISIVFATQRHMPARLRAFIDVMTDAGRNA